MTFEEFDRTKFKPNMYCTYGGTIYQIIGVNFTEKLIEIFDDIQRDETWVRCENIKLKQGEQNVNNTII